MTTDVVLIGWGCCIDTVISERNWSPEEAQHDINYLEMFAACLALKSLSSVVQNERVKLLIVNTTAVTTIHQMGTYHSRVNNQLSKLIWLWCIDHSVWLTVAHIDDDNTRILFVKEMNEWVIIAFLALHSLDNKTLTSVLGIIVRLVKPPFIRYNFTFHCDRIDSDQFPQHAGSIYRIGRWNTCGLLHNDWGNSLES